MLQGFFAAEAAALGAVGATLGFAIGVGVAIWIGHANFHAPVTPRLSVLPVVLVGGIAIALARRDPANISAAAGPTCYHPEGRMT